MAEDNPIPGFNLSLEDSDDEEEAAARVLDGEVSTDKVAKIVKELSLLSLAELKEVALGVRLSIKEKKKVVSPIPLCICGTRLTGQFKELGMCRGCRDIDEHGIGKTYTASQKCRDYWMNRGGREGNKDGDDAPAKK